VWKILCFKNQYFPHATGHYIFCLTDVCQADLSSNFCEDGMSQTEDYLFELPSIFVILLFKITKFWKELLSASSDGQDMDHCSVWLLSATFL
jgi:hypothetical protein